MAKGSGIKYRNKIQLSELKAKLGYCPLRKLRKLRSVMKLDFVIRSQKQQERVEFQILLQLNMNWIMVQIVLK